MYTKEELESMEIPELMGIAEQLGVKVTPSSEMSDVIYAIIDKAAESAASGEPVKRKRTRIAKKDTSKVYTVKGEEGENLDSKSNRKKAKEAPSLFSELPLQPIAGGRSCRRGGNRRGCSRNRGSEASRPEV